MLSLYPCVENNARPMIFRDRFTEIKKLRLKQNKEVSKIGQCIRFKDNALSRC